MDGERFSPATCSSSFYFTVTFHLLSLRPPTDVKFHLFARPTFCLVRSLLVGKIFVEECVSFLEYDY